MSTVNYNTTDMETVISNSSTILSNITSTADTIDGIVGEVDKRVYDYFEFFKELHDKSNYLRYEETNASNFGSWMSDTYNAFLSVKNQTEGNSGKGPMDLPIDQAIGEFPSINVDPSKVNPYKITSEAWDKLSTEEKKVIEAKLKELGFTDDEIQAIKDGNSSVDKTLLDTLDTELQKLNSNGSDVRQVILEKYGFDIFNEDGTIDKDKLALALLMDGRNPEDDYDLVNLLKTKYGIDLFPETPQETPPSTDVGPGEVEVVPPVYPQNEDDTEQETTPATVHTGGGFGGDTFGDEDADLSEIEAMLSGDEDDSLLDGLGNLTGSLINGNKDFDISFAKGKGGVGAGAAGVAGVAGLGAAATAAALIAKKRKSDAILDEDEDGDFDDGLDDDLDEESILNDEDSDDSVSSNNKKKDWLYGLGIGLAGAGLAAGLIAKDDDDDDEDDDIE